LPFKNGRQVYVVNVGALPKRTYRSASPVPALIEKLRLVAPVGTDRV
jgi:hypothetical protein